MPIRERYIPTILAQWQLASCQNPSAERHYEREMRQMRRTATSPGERRRVEEHRRLWRQVRMRAARTPLAGGGAIADMAKMAHNALQNLLTALNKSLEELSGLHDIRKKAIETDLVDNTQISQAYNMVRGYARADQDGGMTFFKVIEQACEASNNVAAPQNNEIVYVESGENCCPYNVSGAMSMNILARIGKFDGNKVVPVFAQVLNAHPDIKAKYFQEQCKGEQACQSGQLTGPMITHDHFMILMRELDQLGNMDEDQRRNKFQELFSSAGAAGAAADASADASASADAGATDVSGAVADDHADDSADSAGAGAAAAANAAGPDPPTNDEMMAIVAKENEKVVFNDDDTITEPVIMYTLKDETQNRSAGFMARARAFIWETIETDEVKYITDEQEIEIFKSKPIYVVMNTAAKISEERNQSKSQQDRTKKEDERKAKQRKKHIEECEQIIAEFDKLKDKDLNESDEGLRKTIIEEVNKYMDSVLTGEPEEDNLNDLKSRAESVRLQLLGLRRSIAVINSVPKDIQTNENTPIPLTTQFSAFSRSLTQGRSAAIRFEDYGKTELRQACVKGNTHEQLFEPVDGDTYLDFFGCPKHIMCYKKLQSGFDPEDRTMFTQSVADKSIQNMPNYVWDKNPGVHQDNVKDDVFVKNMIKSAFASGKHVYMFGMGISGSGKTFFLQNFINKLQTMYQGRSINIEYAKEIYGAIVPARKEDNGTGLILKGPAFNRQFKKAYFKAIYNGGSSEKELDDGQYDNLVGTFTPGNTFIEIITHNTGGNGNFGTLWENIDEERKCTGSTRNPIKTISHTPNNSESSRSVIFFKINIDGKSIFLVDLPGAENTWSLVSQMIKKITMKLTYSLRKGMKTVENIYELDQIEKQDTREQILSHILALNSTNQEFTVDHTLLDRSPVTLDGRPRNVTENSAIIEFKAGAFDEHTTQQEDRLKAVQKIILEGGFIDKFVGDTMKNLWHNKTETRKYQIVESEQFTHGDIYKVPEKQLSNVLSLLAKARGDTETLIQESIDQDMWLMLMILRSGYHKPGHDNDVWKKSLQDVLSSFSPGEAHGLGCDTSGDTRLDNDNLIIKNMEGDNEVLQVSNAIVGLPDSDPLKKPIMQQLKINIKELPAIDHSEKFVPYTTFINGYSKEFDDTTTTWEKRKVNNKYTRALEKS